MTHIQNCLEAGRPSTPRSDKVQLRARWLTTHVVRVLAALAIAGAVGCSGTPADLEAETACAGCAADQSAPDSSAGDLTDVDDASSSGDEDLSRLSEQLLVQNEGPPADASASAPEAERQLASVGQWLRCIGGLSLCVGLSIATAPICVATPVLPCIEAATITGGECLAAEGECADLAKRRLATDEANAVVARAAARAESIVKAAANMQKQGATADERKKFVQANTAAIKFLTAIKKKHGKEVDDLINKGIKRGKNELKQTATE